jgi:hypothetical protein
MPETTNGKIQILLEKAARQNESPTPDASSTASATRICPSESEAEELFSQFHQKLFHISQWNNESVISSFELFDEKGISQPEKRAVLGDFIKITLPGSGKSDWVKIIEVDETPNEVIVSVRPSLDPTDETKEKTVSHFFTADATNNFCLQRIKEKLNFYVIGLSEKTNTAETDGVLETARNLATANLGRYLGIQKTQWETFCENFLEKKTDN